ncbi:MAG: adenylyltransferase/cytidyltransferase family protein [bacterium]
MFVIPKLISRERLTQERMRVRNADKRLVLTNGCFDLLHAGHIYALEQAAQQGDVLWVGVNSDNSVRRLKGPTRPIYNEEARLYMLNALQCVSGLFLFDGDNLAPEMELVQPDVYVKSGDYSLEKLNPAERQALLSCQAKIVFAPFLQGWSTTYTIEQIEKKNL